ncbi:MAG: hypothetical protein SWH78_14070 [Thermodesulfobacteriota bacterium]|nr:hypothetical protein [Thermodesulfobacteriota bacterium]
MPILPSANRDDECDFIIFVQRELIPLIHPCIREFIVDKHGKQAAIVTYYLESGMLFEQTIHRLAEGISLQENFSLIVAVDTKWKGYNDRRHCLSLCVLFCFVVLT